VNASASNITPPNTPQGLHQSPGDASDEVWGRTAGERLAHAAWAIVGSPLMHLTFHNWYSIRRLILRIFGAEIHPSARIRPTVRITHPWNISVGAHTAIGDHAILFSLDKITIGDRVTVSQYAHLCAGTHDSTRTDFKLVRSPITIGSDAWIAADSFVGPGVNIGSGAILGARASAFKDLKEWSIYGGDPAKRLGARQLFAEAPPEN
jgi:putative colanic acid biosynthesis acetyltransferase WcaF